MKNTQKPMIRIQGRKLSSALNQFGDGSLVWIATPWSASSRMSSGSSKGMIVRKWV
jgi:hypothetical protein